MDRSSKSWWRYGHSTTQPNDEYRACYSDNSSQSGIQGRNGQPLSIQLFSHKISHESLQQFVEGSDFCWVFFFYTSDQPDFNGPYGFAKSLATYFAERCMVGTINMSYPSNQATFHNVFGTECVYEDDRPAYERI